MKTLIALATIGIALGALVEPSPASEPTKPIELVIPASTGGGAGQMARLIAVIAKESK